MRLKQYPLVAIDPGMNSMGWAFWNLDQVKKVGAVCTPTAVGLLHAPRKYDLPTRARWLAQQLAYTVGPLKLSFGFDIVSEYPAFHGSIRGWATGDLQKLAFLVGVMAGYFSQQRFTIVTPNEWKGQLPKDVVIRRLQRRFGPGATQTWERDVWDAVGIGLWKMGKF